MVGGRCREHAELGDERHHRRVRVLRAGTWLLDVQAHTIFVGPTDTTTTPGVTYKREGGQLILLTVDGS